MPTHPLRKTLAAVLVTLVALLCVRAQERPQEVSSPMPLQYPTASRTEVAFSYAGDIWTIPRAGGGARRLTSEPVNEIYPVFSPDGRSLAFGRINNATGPLSWDVYVIPAAGGDAVRLTYHPDLDLPVGWTPDGRRVLFLSFRDRTTFLSARLYTVPVEGGAEEALPLPSGWAGSFSPDGRSLAYTPHVNVLDFYSWRNYRGGGTSRIYLARLSDSAVEEIPRANSNDTFPIWMGTRVYFLSDRTGTNNLFSYDPSTKAVTQLTHFEKYDVRWAGRAGDHVVLLQNGAVHLFDPATRGTRKVEVRLSGDFPETRPRRVDPWQWAETINPGPGGRQMVVGARGEIFLVSTEDGTVENLTRTPAAAERAPVFSPDGKSIAYLSQEGDEQRLYIRPTAPGAEASPVMPDAPSSFYAELQWSPDSRRIAFTDARLRLRFYDLGTKSIRDVDASTQTDGTTLMQPAWSPDGRWLAYTKYGANRVRQVMLYSLDSGRAYVVSDPRADAQQPTFTFDNRGGYLYFIGSNQTGLVESQGLSGYPFRSQVARTLYAAVLTRDAPPPQTPRNESDGEVTRARTFQVEPEGIGERVFPLSVGVANPARLLAGHGTLFIVEGGTLHRFTAGRTTAEKFVEGAGNYRLTPDGARLFYRRQGQWAVVSAAGAPPQPADGRFALKPAELAVDPPAEWRLVYDEAWRRMREYFYDPGLHGQDARALKEHFAAYLPNVVTREDLNQLFKETFSHLGVSHLNFFGGDAPAPQGLTAETTGLLGADFEADAGRYRVKRVLGGDPFLNTQSPLARPGVNVREGEYLIALDGTEIRTSENLSRYFLNKAGKPVRLKVAARADGAGARDLSVVPLASEYALRYQTWVRDQRRRVEELSGGRLAYIHMPNTADDGYNAFNRDFFAQLDREGLILDGRFNEGGRAADYVIDVLRRVRLHHAILRAGDDLRMPVGFVEGPKVFLTNEGAGSGGDSLPWMAQRARVGTVVGTRTSGWGIGASTHQLLDGGQLSVPDWGWYDPQTGTWLMENRGITPDVIVENMPADWRRGRDPQLERAVRIALEQLRRNPPRPPKRPRYPVYR